MFRAKENPPKPTKPTKPKYEYILFRNNINNKLLSEVTETDADKLNALILNEISENNLKKAELYAKKLAIYHGVPGLIHYYNIMLKVLKSDIAKGETVDQEACNVLAYLYLAEHITEFDPTVKDEVARLMPTEEITEKDFWQHKIAEMKSLLDTTAFDKYAALSGRGMFQHKEFRSGSVKPM